MEQNEVKTRGLEQLVKEELSEKNLRMLEGKTENATSGIKVKPTTAFSSNLRKLTSRLDNEVNEINRTLQDIKFNEENRRNNESLEAIYKKAVALYNSGSYVEAMKLFNQLINKKGYTDKCKEYINKCDQGIEDLRNRKIQAERKAQTRKKLLKVLIPIITIVLLIVGIKACSAAKEAAHDVSKIDIQVINKESYSGIDENSWSNSETYYVKLTYNITNNTKVDWGYLDIKTYVYTMNNELLGTISTQYGTSLGTSDFRIDRGESLKKTTEISTNNPDDFFTRLYESDLSQFRFKSEVSYGSYYD